MHEPAHVFEKIARRAEEGIRSASFRSGLQLTSRFAEGRHCFAAHPEDSWAIGIEVSPYLWDRHSEQGTPARLIAEMLDHSQVSSVLVYVKSTSSAVERLNQALGGNGGSQAYPPISGRGAAPDGSGGSGEHHSRRDAHLKESRRDRGVRRGFLMSSVPAAFLLCLPKVRRLGRRARTVGCWRSCSFTCRD